jgi:hypothetical protein
MIPLNVRTETRTTPLSTLPFPLADVLADLHTPSVKVHRILSKLTLPRIVLETPL